MTNDTLTITNSKIAQCARWRDYFELCKPRVVALMLLTSYVGMQLAVPGLVPWEILLFGNLGIAFSAGAAAVLNHVVDRHIDKKMQRTERRPIATGRVSIPHALIFSAILGIIGAVTLIYFTNVLTAVLTLLTLVGYAVVYTLYLKHATPQNIVIGGLAGAAPPLLGWTAVTASLDPQAFLLVLIIFVWTPPHFWALAIHRYDDYAKAKVPMLPVTHGIPFTKTCVLLYTLLLFAITLLPFVIGMSGWFYLIGAIPLNLLFLYYSWRLKFSSHKTIPWKTFKFSIVYLMLLFLFLLIDHCLSWGVYVIN